MSLDGLCIRLKGSNICPVIYLNDFFRRLQIGRELQDILSEIAQIELEHENCLHLNIAAITDFGHIKDKIKVKLVNAAKNADYLANKPHTLIADLAAEYYIDLGSCGDGTMSTVITDNLLTAYGITVEELHQTAVSNMSDDARLTSMMEMLFGLADCPSEDAASIADAMYVLTNTSGFNGAAMLLNNTVMDSVADRIGADFLILPSSIHELILIPRKSGIDKDTLEQIVRDVNASQVSPHERLSSHVYTYDLAHHELKLAV